MSRKHRKFKGFFRPKLGDLQKKKKVFAKIQSDFSPKFRKFKRLRGGSFRMGGAIFHFSQKIGLKSTKYMRFCILHKPMGGARAPPAPPPLATLLDILHHTSADNAMNSFMQQYSTLFNSHFPLKKKLNKNFSNSWFTNELNKLLKKKDRMYKKYIKNKLPANHQNYNVARNTYFRKVAIEKQNYFKNLFTVQNIKTTSKKHGIA